MAKYWKLLGEYDSETAAYTKFAGAAGASPYTHGEDARLVGIRCMPSSTAATTLFEAAQFKLTHQNFKPNSIEVGCVGNGLRTAPAAPQESADWSVDQEVKGGVPIVLEGQNIAGTPVTVQVFVWGCFES